jgi:hypothetical protein
MSVGSQSPARLRTAAPHGEHSPQFEDVVEGAIARKNVKLSAADMFGFGCGKVVAARTLQLWVSGS